MQNKVTHEEKASIFQVIRMILWTLAGIRGQKGYEHDIAKIKPHQAIIAGIIGAVIFVLTVVTLVNLAINFLG